VTKDFAHEKTPPASVVEAGLRPRPDECVPVITGQVTDNDH
jgi:hypothetical protein